MTPSWFGGSGALDSTRVEAECFFFFFFEKGYSFCIFFGLFFVFMQIFLIVDIYLKSCVFAFIYNIQTIITYYKHNLKLEGGG